MAKITRRKVICKNCQKEFEKVESACKRSPNHFCSNSCSVSYNNRGVERAERKECLTCGDKTLNNKYCSVQCLSDHKWGVRVAKIESGEEIASDDGDSRRYAKRYLIKKNGHECCRCKNTEWMGEPIPLTCDHIDGDSTHNRLQNFRLLCANCDRQMPTFGSRNKGNGRKNRRKES